MRRGHRAGGRFGDPVGSWGERVGLLSKQAEVTAGSTGSCTPHLVPGREGDKVGMSVWRANGAHRESHKEPGGGGLGQNFLLEHQRNKNPKKLINIFSTRSRTLGPWRKHWGLGNDEWGAGSCSLDHTHPGGEFEDDFPKVMLHTMHIFKLSPS